MPLMYHPGVLRDDEDASGRIEPITAHDRIATLDAVRGVALLGIFIMNMPSFGSSFFAPADVELWPQWWNVAAGMLRDGLFSGKFNSMFSMLFAVGFTLQLQRLSTRSPARAMRIYARRLFWLFVLGVLHACMFWTGDVLHMYAVLGLVLLLMRRWSQRSIVILIVLCLLYAPVSGMARLLTTTPQELDELIAYLRAWEASNNAAYGAGTFMDAAREHTNEMLAFYSQQEVAPDMLAFYIQLFTTMLIGLLLGRWRFFQNAHLYLPLVRRVQWWSLLVGVVTGAGYGLWVMQVVNPLQPTPWSVLAGTAYSLSRIAMTIFYVGVVVRVVHSGRWARVLEALIAVGRMPLTNYLGQTLLATFIFYGWGLGHWGQTGPAFNLVLAVGIFVLLQVPLSRWWLRRFEQGPLEHAWRVLTYGRAALNRPRR